MLTNFHKIFIVIAVKFATKSTSYISPHFNGVTSPLCKTQKTETGKILLYVMQ